MQARHGWLPPPGIDSRTYYKRLESTGRLTETEEYAVRDGSLLLVFFGKLEYRDIFATRELKWCYCFAPNLGWILCGTPEDNEWT